MNFKASKDNTVKIITTCIIIFFVFLAQQCVRDLILASNGTEMLIEAGGLVLLIAILLICYLLSPRFYELKENDLIIHRVIKSRKIEINTILESKLISKQDLKGTYRTFGVGGLFGYFGKFRNHALGAMTWYATQNRNYLLLVLKSGEKIVLTPDDVQLTSVLKEHLT